MTKKPFTCPVCGKRQPFKWLFLGGSKRYILKCKSCHSNLWPDKDPLPATISTPIGFICGTLPFMIHWHFIEKNLILSFIVAIGFGLIGFIIVCFYTYKNTYFNLRKH
jgi:hypothetical protein